MKSQGAVVNSQQQLYASARAIARTHHHTAQPQLSQILLDAIAEGEARQAQRLAMADEVYTMLSMIMEYYEVFGYKTPEMCEAFPNNIELVFYAYGIWSVDDFSMNKALEAYTSGRNCTICKVTGCPIGPFSDLSNQ